MITIDLTELAELSRITKQLNDIKTKHLQAILKSNRQFYQASLAEKVLIAWWEKDIQQLSDKRNELFTALTERCFESYRINHSEI